MAATRRDWDVVGENGFKGHPIAETEGQVYFVYINCFVAMEVKLW